MPDHGIWSEGVGAEHGQDLADRNVKVDCHHLICLLAMQSLAQHAASRNRNDAAPS